MQRTFISSVALGVALGAVPALLAQTSNFTTIDFPGSIGTQAYGMNPRGDIAGFYTLPDKSTHGFLLSGDRYTTINYPGATSTLAGAVSAQGNIAGQDT